jgi:hypothetical protein
MIEFYRTTFKFDSYGVHNGMDDECARHLNDEILWHYISAEPFSFAILFIHLDRYVLCI